MRSEVPLTYEQSLAYALRLLTQRGYSVARLKEKLVRRGASSEIADAVCEKLLTMRLLNDADFAQEVARSQAVIRRTSDRAIAVKLRQKGVPAALIPRAIAHLEEEAPSEYERAHALAERYAHKYRDLEARARREKIAAYLFRRGFATAVIRRVLEAF